MKAYVVKYWETKGIEEVEGEVYKANGNDYFTTGVTVGSLFCPINRGAGAYTNYEDALNYVISAASKKAVKLEKRAIELKKKARDLAKELKG